MQHSTLGNLANMKVRIHLQRKEQFWNYFKHCQGSRIWCIWITIIPALLSSTNCGTWVCPYWDHMHQKERSWWSSRSGKEGGVLPKINTSLNRFSSCGSLVYCPWFDKRAVNAVKLPPPQLELVVSTIGSLLEEARLQQLHLGRS
jgi:hypothetical protein